ncbi:hypothetical protein [Jiangella alba]|uniref:ABC-type transport system involved in multi-copper enzyme maturation, permease component n=1 Tax=Jiangella alba TaxID=561176 RepID=A0A1H5I8I7_9ACTN|nr:hypothetical protein [Jiangella alba]SEE36527.1 hypothetical protein SAMN04488561_1104 [Jiangella alba]
MGRIVRIDLRRGVAALAALLIGGVTLAVLFNDTEMWAGRWTALAMYLRVTLIVVVPLTLAAGAWQGGRDRRRRIEDLLASTPRPRWQRTTAAWAAVATGVAGGYLAAAAILAVLVGRVATYSSGGWWWYVVVAMLALGAAAAVGYAAGTLLPWRLTAPVLGFLGYLGMGLLTYVVDGRSWLSPALNNVVDGVYLPLGDHLLQAAWFTLIGIAALTLIGSQRWWPVLAPAALAAAAGTVLASGPAHERFEPDPVAREIVCVEGDPQVCTSRETEFLLDDYVTVARETLARFDGIDGLPDRVQAVLSYDDLDDGSIYTSVGQYISWSGSLAPRAEFGSELEVDLVHNVLPGRWCDSGTDANAAELVSDLADAAMLWAGVDPASGRVAETDGGGHIAMTDSRARHADPVDGALHVALTSLPRAEQLDWIERYIVAGRDCDLTALAALRDELR